MTSQQAAPGLQIEIPSSQGLTAVAELTQTQNLHQKLLYIGCMSAAAASANFHQNADTTVPLLEQLALDDYEPEEVKLEVALQLGPLGNGYISYGHELSALTRLSDRACLLTRQELCCCRQADA